MEVNKAASQPISSLANVNQSKEKQLTSVPDNIKAGGNSSSGRGPIARGVPFDKFESSEERK